MDQTKWTPEPWVVAAGANAQADTPATITAEKMVSGYHRDKIGCGIVCVSDDRAGRFDEQVNADFDRVVACVNAMAGIENPAALRAYYERFLR